VNALSAIIIQQRECDEQGKPVTAILADESAVARGHVFTVEHQDKYYILVNSLDLDAAIASAQMNGVSLGDRIYRAPLILEDTHLTLEVCTGVFQCALPVR
jgi:hypothetical protein